MISCAYLTRLGMKVQGTKSHRQCFRTNFRLFKILTLFLCFALFILLTLDVFNKFFKGMTNVGIVSQGIDNSSKVLPCVTLCPWSGNKVNLTLLIFLTYSPGSNKHCCTVLNIRSHKQVFNYKVPIAI